jgi:hypothetical protein
LTTSTKTKKPPTTNKEDDDNVDNDDDDDDGDDDGDLVGYYSYVYPPPPTPPPSSEDNINNNKDNNNGSNNNINDTTATTNFSIKFIILDGYDISLMKRSKTKSKKYKLAKQILKKENPINYKARNLNSPEGLGLGDSDSGNDSTQKRFVAFNGAVGEKQLLWLDDELKQSRNDNHQNQNQNQKVIIICHQSIHPDSSNHVCLLWNYEKVLNILRSYSDIVIASFSGHAHKGGYVRDPVSGIHFRIIEAILESKPSISTYGILEIYHQNIENENENENTQSYIQNNENIQNNQNCIVLKGYGDCQSSIYDFNHCNNNNEWKNSNSTNFETATATATATATSTSTTRTTWY